LLKPKRLFPGDKIAIISPSWGGPFCFHHIYEDGLDFIKNELNLEIVEFPTARMNPKILHDNPELRAKDINDAFADKSIKGIICTIGGNDSIRILKYLNMNIITSNPKILIGYSDNTTLLTYLNLHGIITYYGSGVMAGYSHINCFPKAITEYKKVLFTDEAYELLPFTEWADSYKNWDDVSNRKQVTEILIDNTGHHWLNKNGKTNGKIWGGCIEVLNMMNGTFAWPNVEFFSGKILMLETSEDKPSPEQVGFILRNYGIQGILQSISGLLIAKPKSYSDLEKKELEDEVIKIVINEFSCTHLNIISNIDFGHTDPRHIIPLGINIELDSLKEHLTFTESLFL